MILGLLFGRRRELAASSWVSLLHAPAFKKRLPFREPCIEALKCGCVDPVGLLATVAD